MHSIIRKLTLGLVMAQLMVTKVLAQATDIELNTSDGGFDIIADLARPVILAIVFTVIGLALFAVAIWIIVKMAPFSVRKEIEEDQNVALGLIVGAIILGIAIVLAAGLLGQTRLPWTLAQSQLRHHRRCPDFYHGQIGADEPHASAVPQRVRNVDDTAWEDHPTLTYQDVTSGNLADLTVTERKWELAGEWIRWNDLVRLELVADAFANRDPQVTPDVVNGGIISVQNDVIGSTGTDNYFAPITIREVELLPGLGN